MAKLLLGTFRLCVQGRTKAQSYGRLSVRGLRYRQSVHPGIVFEEEDEEEESLKSDSVTQSKETSRAEIASVTRSEETCRAEIASVTRSEETCRVEIASVTRSEETSQVQNSSETVLVESAKRQDLSTQTKNGRYRYVPTLHEGIVFEEEIETKPKINQGTEVDFMKWFNTLEDTSESSNYKHHNTTRQNHGQKGDKSKGNKKPNKFRPGKGVNNAVKVYATPFDGRNHLNDSLKGPLKGQSKAFTSGTVIPVGMLSENRDPSACRDVHGTRGAEAVERGRQVDEGRKPLHIPVLVDKVVEMLDPKPGQVFVDMTFGAGGHTRALLEREKDIRIYALDRDPDAHELATELSTTQPNVIPLLGKFSDLHQLLLDENIAPGSVDGILMDTGASSVQYDKASRGFSLSKDGPLDMRMDKNRIPNQPTAADVVNFSDVNTLSEILKVYGDEKMARQIARAIDDHRASFGRVTGTMELADIVSRVYGEGVYKRDSLNRNSHVATKTFMALRIFVNNELNELNNGLELAHYFLSRGGACAAVTFHSLEDRIVKRHFHGIDMDSRANMNIAQKGRAHQALSEQQLIELLTKKWIPKSKRPIGPDGKELGFNPRSRSAKLRVAVKS